MAWEIGLYDARSLSNNIPSYATHVEYPHSQYGSFGNISGQGSYIPYGNNPYIGQNNYYDYNNPPPYEIIQQPTGNTTTIIYTDVNPCYPHYHRRCRRYSGSDMALGAMTGMAIGSLMWSPFMWI